MAPPFTLRLFGTPRIETSAGPGPAFGNQPIALLAVLACAGERGMPRDKVLALFWPEATPGRAAHRLSQLTHAIRRRLNPEDVIAGTSDLRLGPERVRCDLWEFEAARREGELERAATLYTAPLLDGFFVADSPEVERWLDRRRAALAREHLEILEALAMQAEARGDTQQAALWWHQLAEHDPLSSRVTMRLMTALAASGNRVRALQRAQAYEKHFREELEAEPNPAVLALARRLKTAGPRPAAIGVLPIEPLDGGEETSQFAQGVTEELTSLAAGIPGLRVAARTSLVALHQELKDLRETGARLGLNAVLEGSLRRSGRRVRLTMRLVDVADGCQRWAGWFEREVDDEFAGQEALAREVVEAMRRQLGGAVGEPAM
jgi:DNA-binding SARP family transcriptional activator